MGSFSIHSNKKPVLYTLLSASSPTSASLRLCKAWMLPVCVFDHATVMHLDISRTERRRMVCLAMAMAQIQERDERMKNTKALYWNVATIGWDLIYYDWVHTEILSFWKIFLPWRAQMFDPKTTLLLGCNCRIMFLFRWPHILIYVHVSLFRRLGFSSQSCSKFSKIQERVVYQQFRWNWKISLNGPYITKYISKLHGFKHCMLPDIYYTSIKPPAYILLTWHMSQQSWKSYAAKSPFSVRGQSWSWLRTGLWAEWAHTAFFFCVSWIHLV